MYENCYERITSFRLTRWEALPSVDLYMDQVLELVNQTLAPLYPNEPPLMTSSMVNNYVKHKLISKPVNKRYRKGHIASLIAITILKSMYPISTVANGLEEQRKVHGDDVAYNMFCDAIESAFLALASQLKAQDVTPLLHARIEHEDFFVQLAAITFAARYVSEDILNNQLMKIGETHDA